MQVPSSNTPASPIPIQVALRVFLDGQQQTIFDDQLGREVKELILSDRLIIGRQDVTKGDPNPFRTITFTNHRKLIVTPYERREVSRRSLDLALDPQANYMRVGNIGTHEVDIVPTSEGRIAHHQVRTFVVEDLKRQPIRLMVAKNIAIEIGVNGVVAEKEFPQPTHNQTSISQSVTDVAMLLRQSRMTDGYATPHGPSSADIERILSAVSAVLEKAASSPDFFITAAEKVCNLGNFDSCSYLGLDPTTNQWQCEATWPAYDSGRNEEPHFDSKALEYVWSHRKTWATPPSFGEATVSQRIVVTPVLSHDFVVGALYATKQQGMLGDDVLIDCEVKFVEVIRDCLTVGLERLKQEQEAAKHQVCLAQFFPPGIADRILYDETLLETREENISVLFCDIRGFSTISSAIGSIRTMEWLRDVLGELSESVIRYDGVLLEYVGDEMVAMWGAPDAQPNHADLACQAAVDMIGKLERLNESWSDRIPRHLLPFGLTIGINTGDCVVGKKGTEYKYMWGPLGPTVNIASRVQGATKHFCPKRAQLETGAAYQPPNILITDATRLALRASMPTRQLGSIQVVNIPEPIRVHQLATTTDGQWNHLCQKFELALQQFESRHFLDTLNTLDQISHIDELRADGPTCCLRDRALALLQDPHLAGDDHPTWKLDQK
ncbi:adenylate/guanylate cyclase domain-containing protein [Bremerella cremea]|uniref:Adenylate/guanylate cyclase domain-containing protein n=1 Tax=Bremerella cremea TaxID=1031537 RepID=A0A368KSM4_9BACT|nr:adenylate/guanylate cyclase domain-containing protein [Bremerella cremea]RCS52670.1 adenylate/guanylate cyclase domain-containing protein [Bremerella cremea]